MSAPGDGDTVTKARTALLDALDALGPLREAVILIGAQAIYLHTADAPVAMAAFTVDADIQLDTRKLAGEPLIENAMRDAGFSLNATSNQPGAWVSEGGIPVDLMVAASQAGGGNRRARTPLTTHMPRDALPAWREAWLTTRRCRSPH